MATYCFPDASEGTDSNVDPCDLCSDYGQCEGTDPDTGLYQACPHLSDEAPICGGCTCGDCRRDGCCPDFDR